MSRHHPQLVPWWVFFQILKIQLVPTVSTLQKSKKGGCFLSFIRIHLVRTVSILQIINNGWVLFLNLKQTVSTSTYYLPQSKAKCIGDGISNFDEFLLKDNHICSKHTFQFMTKCLKLIKILLKILQIWL